MWNEHAFPVSLRLLKSLTSFSERENTFHIIMSILCTFPKSFLEYSPPIFESTIPKLSRFYSEKIIRLINESIVSAKLPSLGNRRAVEYVCLYVQTNLLRRRCSNNSHGFTVSIDKHRNSLLPFLLYLAPVESVACGRKTFSSPHSSSSLQNFVLANSHYFTHVVL